MLAKKYDNYAWQEPVENEREQTEYKRAPRPHFDSRSVLRNRIIMILAVIFATYLVVVVRSEAMVAYGNRLVEMQQQEAQLINKNNELKIEVEQLKGPDRIIGLAEQRLGMNVARSNIYVKSAQTPNKGNSFAVKDK